ncbi:MAG TPA: LamG-like jellyroll fold domain-containing protein [Chitinophagaceae bacterium]|nr:LamG-like jellyroll fold domain-containing protein [Chitinophagaceae bacterium]
MKKVLLLTTIACIAWAQSVLAQPNVFNPADPIVYYNSGPAPTTAWNNQIQKWVITNRNLGWNTSSYKAYHVNGVSFRLKFPTSYQHNVDDGKKYPIMLFWHGAGEKGWIYDNELQLLHGGQFFRDKVNNGSFDGFLLYPQNQSGFAGQGDMTQMILVIDSLAKYCKVDINKVFIDGLSAGGQACFQMLAGFPTRVTKAAPTSAAVTFTPITNYIHIPVWMGTGEVDSNPDSATQRSTYLNFKNAGGDMRWSQYAGQGHFVWYNHWQEPDFIPYMNDMYKSNPLVFFGRTQFCPDSLINPKIGITAGFMEYQWAKDDTITGIIAGATSNEYTANSLGTYYVRFRRTYLGEWSLWSPKPAVITSKTTTVTPLPVVNGLRSKVLPAPDGSTTVPLKLPAGFEKYEWYRVSDNALISNLQICTTGVGTYKARVKEFFGCSAFFSPEFTVANANGVNKPDPAKNLTAIPASLTSIQLDWSDNPNAAFNETGFEVYRGTGSGGPYTLVGITATDVLNFLDQGLSPNTTYYYIVRAVNATAAAANSNEASTSTNADVIAPTVPGNLRVIGATRTQAYLQWDASTDNVGVNKYDVFVNGVKLYTTGKTLFVVNGLTPFTTNNFVVKARDVAGNSSAASNQVTAYTKLQGLIYYYYQGDWDVLPDFNSETVIKAGISSQPSLSVRNRDDQFGFMWQGYILAPTTGTYELRTCSDDGSQLFFNQFYSIGTEAFIDNDGLHGVGTCVSNTVSMTAGQIYPITLTYFEQGGDQAMNFTWKTPGSGSFVTIPSSAFSESGSGSGTIPTMPNGLRANATGYNKIQLNWTDRSNNETGFEIVRSTSINGTYQNIFTAAADATSYLDSGLNANTIYFYKIRAIGTAGESGFSSNFNEVNWKVNNNLNDAFGVASRAMTGTNTSFVNTAGNVKEGTHALSFNGTSSVANVNNSSSGQFPSAGGYTQRTVGLWIKPSSTSNNKFIFDFGNNQNGMGLRFNSTNSALQAGVASGGTRTSITLNNVTSNGNWVSGGWNHVAVVLNGNSLLLFLNGVQVAQNTSLPTNGVASNANNNSRFGNGGSASGDNVFSSTPGSSDWFNGLMDDIYVINGALTNTDIINMMMTNTWLSSADTTFALPAAPAAPTVLTATATSSFQINLQWNDNSATETGYEVYRSTNNNSNFRLIDTVPGGAGAQKNYVDAGLFANVRYYYRVRAFGTGGTSAYSNEANAKTFNTKPEMSDIFDFTMRFNTADTLDLLGTDADADALTWTFDNLPGFATVENISNGHSQIIFNPTFNDQGGYVITVHVDDGNGGTDTKFFNMVVNENYPPTLDPINNVTMSEGGDTTFNLTGNDVESPTFMQWQFTNLPSWATFSHNGNGTGSLRLKPGYAGSGVYNITVRLEDDFGGWVSRSFTVTVNEKDPNDIFKVNIKSTHGLPQPNAWNDMTSATLNNLKNTLGVTTGVGVQLQFSGFESFNLAEAGAQTGNNSGVWPDLLMNDFAYWGFFQGTNLRDTVTLHVTGLTPSNRYTFKLFPSSTFNLGGANSVTFKNGAQSQVVDAFNNINNFATLSDIQPNASGEIDVTIIGDPNPDKGGYLNLFEIIGDYDDGTIPAKPTNLSGNFQQQTGVVLSWTDVAYNETSYKVYRSTSPNSGFVLLNPLGNKNTATYTDASVATLTTYYYYLRAGGNAGDSPTSDTISVLTGNNKPTITNLTNVFVKTNTSVNEDFSVSDDIGDAVNVTSPNLPSFATLQNLGSNNYRIAVSPTANNEGRFTVTIVATDDKGAFQSQDISIQVSDRNTRSIYVNLAANGNTMAGDPYNDYVGSVAGAIFNLKDESGVATPFNFTLGGTIQGANTNGHITGNNSGIISDAALQAGIQTSSANPITVTFGGLNATKKYNIVFIGSANDGLPAMVDFSASGVSTVTLNTRNNWTKSVQLNGLTPNGSNQITANMVKQAASNFAYLNAVILEEYTDTFTTSLINPINLVAEPVDKTHVLLTWSDRSNAETGYIVQRATAGANGPWTTLTTVNATTHNDATASQNTRYWYRVIATKTTAPTRSSDPSNVVSTITPESIVYVNFDFTFPANAPWNNLNANPDEGKVFPNMLNDANVNTGITLEITKHFNGQFNAGMTTAASGGIFPDPVMASNYWLDPKQIGQWKISNLNLSKRYRFGFFGSTGPGWYDGDFTSKYTIGNRTVYLNAHKNDSKVVYIGDVVPDANGEVLLNISTTEAAAFGFTAAILIEAYNDAVGGIVPNGINNTQGTDFTDVSGDKKNTVSAQNPNSKPVITSINAYPNPFINNLSIDFYNNAAGNEVSVDIYDLTGRLVYRRNAGNVPVGPNTLKLNIQNSGFTSGVYLVKLNINGQIVNTAKLVKSRQ